MSAFVGTEGGQPPVRISREQYVTRYGPTAGDRIRLGDTDLWVRVEIDHAAPGDEPMWGYAKNLRSRMTQFDRATTESELDMVLLGVVLIDPLLGVVKADIGIKDGRIRSSRRPGKDDRGDAVAVARVALREQGLPRASAEVTGSDLKLLVDARDQLVAEATRTRNRLHALLLTIAPGYQEQIRDLTSSAALLVARRLASRARGTDRVRSSLACSAITRLRFTGIWFTTARWWWRWIALTVGRDTRASPMPGMLRLPPAPSCPGRRPVRRRQQTVGWR